MHTGDWGAAWSLANNRVRRGMPLYARWNLPPPTPPGGERYLDLDWQDPTPLPTVALSVTFDRSQHTGWDIDFYHTFTISNFADLTGVAWTFENGNPMVNADGVPIGSVASFTLDFGSNAHMEFTAPGTRFININALYSGIPVSRIISIITTN